MSDAARLCLAQRFATRRRKIYARCGCARRSIRRGSRRDITASIATTAGLEARCARGSVRPAARSRGFGRSMIELVSACSEMRLPVGATTSKASSIAPVEGEGILPKVLPM